MIDTAVKFISINSKNIWKLIKRIRYNYFPVNYDIIISINSAEGFNSGQYLKQLNSDFIKYLNKGELNKKLKIKNLSDVVKFEKNEKALSYVRKKNINLLIWGEFSVDNLKQDGENVNELSLNYTYLHPNDIDGIIGKLINIDLDSQGILKNDIKIHENNSFIEIKILSKDLFNLSMYTIAITLKFFKEWKISSEILEELYNRISNDNQFRSSVKFHLYNCYDLISFDLLRNRKYEVAEIILRKMLIIDPSNYLVKSNLARCCFEKGEIENMESLINEAYNQAPNHPLCQLNYAYLSIRKKDYKKAYRMYQKFFEHSKINFEPVEAIEFLNSEYLKLNDPALIYGSAILNYELGDKKIGMKDLKRFVNKANNEIMPEMIKKAKQLIESKENI